MPTTILINGIDTLLGAQVAHLLSTQNDLSLIGVGRTQPPAPVEHAETLIAALNGQQMVEVLRARQVDVVVHLAIAGEERPLHGYEAAVQHNVLGSMQLLGACAAAGVRQVVLRSSSLVYGAHHTNPAFFSEAHPRHKLRGGDLLSTYSELDMFATEFACKHSSLRIALLRCAALVGGKVSSPFTRYLTQPMPRMQPGFNPRIQVLHPHDAASAFALAATRPVSGAFNVAAEPPLTLAQAIRLAGRQPAPLLTALVNFNGMLGSRRPPCTWPFKPALLRYGCVVDTGRATRELGWHPTHRAEATLRELRSRATHHEPHEPHEQPDTHATLHALHTFLERHEKHATPER
jgi:UDP-glucose 4-epimerase